MGVRVDTQGDINFGVMNSSVTVSHVRFRRASDDGQPVVLALSSPVTASSGEGFRIRSGMFDIVYKSGPLGNAHMLAVVESYWGASGSRTEMEVDLMTNDSTVVSDSGYSQQSYNNWSIATEAD